MTRPLVLIAFLSLCALLAGCAPDEVRVEGLAQKGPFQIGSTVTVQTLDDRLQPSGKVYQVETTDHLGSFSVPRVITSRFLQVEVTGLFASELYGNQVGPTPITLRAYADLQAGPRPDKDAPVRVHVNVLTHLQSARLLALVQSGKPYAEAEVQSRSEVLALFNIPAGFGESFHRMDLLGTRDSDAILLAISSLLLWAAHDGGINDAATTLGRFVAMLNDVRARLATTGTMDDAGFASQITQASQRLSGGIASDAVFATSHPLRDYYRGKGVDAVFGPWRDFLDGNRNGTIDRLDTGDGSSLTVCANGLSADGTSPCTVVVTTRDANGELLPNEAFTVEVSGAGNSRSHLTERTDSQGQYTFTFTSSRAEVKVLTLKTARGSKQRGVFFMEDWRTSSAYVEHLGGLHRGDFNGDGKWDLLFSTYRADSMLGDVGVLINDGTGRFASGSLGVATGLYASVLDTADLDADGRTDILLRAHSPTETHLLRNEGNGTFSLLKKLPGMNQVRIADINGDGLSDLLLGQGAMGFNGTLQVFLNTGGGLFGAATSYAVPASGGSYFDTRVRLFVADMNGDGAQDVVTLGSGLESTGRGTMQVFINDGSGALTPSPSPVSMPRITAVSDVNGDGKADVLTNDSDVSSIYLNDGTGKLLPPTPAPFSMTIDSLVDTNGDGRTDLVGHGRVLGGLGDTYLVAFNDGSGQFSGGVPLLPLASTGYALVTGDFDADGRNDVAVATREDHLAIFLTRPAP
jgi:hypothetical protein